MAYNTTSVYDVAIVGCGPAGAAAALSLLQLRPSLRVAVLERSSFDEWRAGETLAPGCQEILRGLGCWESIRGAGFIDSPGTRSVWGSPRPYENDFLFSLRGNGWHVDRARFDGLLCHAVRQAGADVLDKVRVSAVEHATPGFRLGLQGAAAGSPDTILARFAIDASGRRASFAAQCGARRLSDDRLVGVCGLLASATRDAATMVEAQPDGWWYSAVLPEGRLLAAWMSDADLVRDQGLCEPEAWLKRLRAAEWTAGRTAGGLLAPLRVCAAHSQRLDRAQGESWAAAGDAATAYDPLSSLGILKALRSGKVASFVAIDALEGRQSGDRYETFLQREYTAYCETRRWFYGQEQRWPDSLFWRRREKGDHAEWQSVNN